MTDFGCRVFPDLFVCDFRYKATREPAFLTAQVNTHKSAPMAKAWTTNPAAHRRFQADHGIRLRSTHREKKSSLAKTQCGWKTLMKSCVLCVAVEESCCAAINASKFTTVHAMFHLSSAFPGKFGHMKFILLPYSHENPITVVFYVYLRINEMCLSL